MKPLHTIKSNSLNLTNIEIYTIVAHQQEGFKKVIIRGNRITFVFPGFKTTCKFDTDKDNPHRGWARRADLKEDFEIIRE